MRLACVIPIAMIMLLSMSAGAGEKVLPGAPVSKHSSSNKPDAKKWYYPFETGELRIRQSNDGTGIIKNVSCHGCDYQLVRITPHTKVVVNAREVDLLRARERAGKPAFIEFDRQTAEVKYIYWAE